MTSSRLKVTDILAERLASRHGVSQVFLIPGGGAMHLNDSFGKHPGIRVLCNHHEQASAIAAEGYARVSGKLAVVNVTSGPGGLNTLNGVFGQWTDSIPVLYLSGQIKQETSVYSQPELNLRQLGDQEVDIVRVVRPITKMAETLRDPKDARRVLDKAVAIATTGRPGPVWLDVPLDVQGAWVEQKDLRDYDEAEDLPRTEGMERINQVLALLQASKRPVFIAGHGIRISKVVPEFLDLAKRLAIPVVGTLNGMDIVPWDHPCFIGRIGTIGSRAGNFALQNSDLVISVGSRNNIRQISYFWQAFARAAKKVVVDIDSAELSKHTLVPDLPVLMDAGAFIRSLAERSASTRIPDFGWWLGWCLERKRRYPPTPPAASNGHLEPYGFLDKLLAALEENTIVVTANSTACIAAFQMARVKRGQRYIWNSGCASMGYCLPAAIGASLASPGSPVICLTGDGSIMMNLQELETIGFHQLPIKIFLLNNGGYVSMRQTQNAFFEGRLIGEGPSSGIGFPDFLKVAEACEIPGERIAAPEGLEQKIGKTLGIPGPLLCEVMLPPDHIFSPKLSSARLPDGRMVSKPLEDLSPLLDREEFRSNMLIPPLEE